ncbi:MAG: trehalose-6-phosphate synthase [Candidatus Omnitrophica bacterium]|nr:trehalose-6-phosphate synthase [Candidatus Omnitrophota bacterium]
MRRILLFILPILIIVTMAFIGFGIFQVKSEEARLLDELMRKAKAVAESMELSVKHALANNNVRDAMWLVEKFQRRERSQGCVIYDKEGNIVAITDRFSEWKHRPKPYIKSAIADKLARGDIEQFKDYSVYSYVLPITDDEGNVVGLEEVLYDTSYVFTQLAELWKRLSTVLIALVVFIILISLLVQRQIFTAPVEQLTEWFRQFQKGEIDTKHPIKEKGELGKLASEVEQAALSIRVARKAASEEATERIQKEDLWTDSKLKDVVKSKLGENALFLVSNREPYMHIFNEISGKAECTRPASGVVTALDPIMRACGGTWVAHGSASADRKFVNSKNKLGVPPREDRYILKRVWLTKEEEDGYYYGFSNEGLWPLCHITYTRPIFRELDWQTYKKVNRKFADSLLEELPAKNPFIFIQDYHFTLLPQMIKEKRPDATVALFWHIPWPNPEVFSICPYQAEILDGMLGCDLIGFHVQYHCNNFIDTVDRMLECRVDSERFSIVRANKETLVRAFPISVDSNINSIVGQNEGKEITRIRKEYGLENKMIALGVDRIDYTKGLTERMMAVDRFLEKYPEYKGKFVFVQLGAPSRTHIKRYHDLIGELDELAEKINWKYMDDEWKPILYLKRHFSPEEIKPYYRIADICIVSSLHDGMNLVAKEYIAAKNDLNGSLMLSRFTGAARELTDAIQINPYSIEDFADSIKLAADMPLPEKKRRMKNMRKIISDDNIYKWAGDIITELTTIKKV